MIFNITISNHFPYNMHFEIISSLFYILPPSPLQETRRVEIRRVLLLLVLHIFSFLSISRQRVGQIRVSSSLKPFTSHRELSLKNFSSLESAVSEEVKTLNSRNAIWNAIQDLIPQSPSLKWYLTQIMKLGRNIPKYYVLKILLLTNYSLSSQLLISNWES